ncbi:haloalkane dehalogenase [Geodermatophilus sp. TF02-6]|uniref:haloalkane dehalogenase n=1 Tax=Geodermatophilus sp. TF02-6 TaxID=2250575 RepID=UPI000DEBC07E|nr:haloalkane dehalogenase [Geodermatophilus sp. TF02-6]RBY77644.1 haloalkane dehalogenase [Geodermatophilus sp. TF02-6]
MAADDVSPEDPFPRKRVRVDRRADGTLEMAYVEVGEGDPIVFLHGNPTSSYLWRNVIPHVARLGRCLAPDLIGMGESDKIADPGPGTYSFATHAGLLERFLDQVGARERVTFVLHDWGSALGFDWAQRHRDAVRGLAFTEAIVVPLTWADWPAAARGIFSTMRGPDGEAAVLEKNVFVERILPASVARGLSRQAHDRYRAPFRTPEERWPTLEWPRQIPIESVPPKVHDVVSRYGQWLRHSDVPKLFLDADPGSILVGRPRAFVRKWAALSEVTVPGAHFVPEDSPHEIGRALAEWIPTLR